MEVLIDPVTVLLVDDESSVTEALAWLLDSVKIPSRSFHSPTALLNALDHGQLRGPCCAVLDLRMPEMSGLELQQRLLDAGHDLPLIFLTAHGDVPAAVNAMQAGAMDFVQKPFNSQAFLGSIHRAVRRARERFQAQTRDHALKEELRRLSVREQDVLHSLLNGRTSKEIARELDISPKTVDVHRANIMRKLSVANGAELIRKLSHKSAMEVRAKHGPGS